MAGDRCTRNPAAGSQRHIARNWAYYNRSLRIADANISAVMSPGLGKNPYRPGVGTKPLYLAGRDQSIRRFRSVIRAAPELPANIRLTGLRGVGKTVLLGEFGDEARELGWATTYLEFLPGHSTDDGLTAALVQALKATRAEVSRVERLKGAVGGAARKAG